MEESAYRQSRLCRLLGNPVAFGVVVGLLEHNEMSPSEIANVVGRSLQRVSNILAALRLADVVRYETAGTRARYRLKYPRERRKFLSTLEKLIQSASTR